MRGGERRSLIAALPYHPAPWGPGPGPACDGAMSHSRTFLIWLCSALTSVAGVRVEVQAPCNQAGVRGVEQPSCCLTDCACGHGADSAPQCDCDREQAPAREPALPAPRPEQPLAPEPSDMPVLATPVHHPSPHPRVAAGLPIGLLPLVSRQEALSVWSC